MEELSRKIQDQTVHLVKDVVNIQLALLVICIVFSLMGIVLIFRYVKMKQTKLIYASVVLILLLAFTAVYAYAVQIKSLIEAEIVLTRIDWVSTVTIGAYGVIISFYDFKIPQETAREIGHEISQEIHQGREDKFTLFGTTSSVLVIIMVVISVLVGFEKDILGSIASDTQKLEREKNRRALLGSVAEHIDVSNSAVTTEVIKLREEQTQEKRKQMRLLKTQAKTTTDSLSKLAILLESNIALSEYNQTVNEHIEKYNRDILNVGIPRLMNFIIESSDSVANLVESANAELETFVEEHNVHLIQRIEDEFELNNAKENNRIDSLNNVISAYHAEVQSLKETSNIYARKLDNLSQKLEQFQTSQDKKIDGINEHIQNALNQLTQSVSHLKIAQPNTSQKLETLKAKLAQAKDTLSKEEILKIIEEMR